MYGGFSQAAKKKGGRVIEVAVKRGFSVDSM